MTLEEQITFALRSFARQNLQVYSISYIQQHLVVDDLLRKNAVTRQWASFTILISTAYVPLLYRSDRPRQIQVYDKGLQLVYQVLRRELLLCNQPPAELMALAAKNWPRPTWRNREPQPYVSYAVYSVPGVQE